MADDFTIISSALPPGARVAGFRGAEGISRCYELDIDIVVGGDEQVDPEDAIGLRAALLVAVRGEQPMIFHGLVGAFELLRSVDAPGSTPRVTTLYRLKLVPQLWFLGATRHSRIFVGKTVVELITDVLELEGMDSEDFEFRLKKTYPVEEHVCQYRESSLAFVSRWMEREGLYYFFDHSESRERLVVTDDEGFAEPCPLTRGPIAYFPDLGRDSGAGPHFDELMVQKASTVASLRIDDYDFVRPALDLSTRAAVAKGTSGELASYGNRYFDPADAERLAAIRAQEIRAQAMVYSMSGAVHRMRSGYTYGVVGHPIQTLDTQYLACEIEHRGHSRAVAAGWEPFVDAPTDVVYRVRVRGLPRTIAYRSSTKTPWPRVDGFENATIDGPLDSEYAQLDAQGSYFVAFKFDEGTRNGHRASTRVRMMQPHGGGAEGFHFPLRKGTEVLCAFLAGDPDRPVIIGVVPNLVKPSPVVESNQTQNIIQTGGRTYMCIDDQEGAKFASFLCPYVPGMQSELYLGYGRPDGGATLTQSNGPQRTQQGEFMDSITQPNMHLRTTGTGMISTVGPLDISASGTLQLESDTKAVFYAPQWFRQISGTVWDHVGSLVLQNFDDEWKVNVGAGVEHRYGDTFDHYVKSKVSQVYDDAQVVMVAKTQAVEVGEAATQLYKQGLTTTIDGDDAIYDVKTGYALKVELDAHIHSKDTVVITGEQKLILQTNNGAARIILEKDTILIEANTVSIQGNNSVAVNAPLIRAEASGNHVLKGGMVLINCDG